MSIFVRSLGLLFSVQFSIKFYFLVYVNQSLSCIRRCRTDLLSIIFPVFFARFLSHLLYFQLFFVRFSVHVSLIQYFPFFCCNCFSESRSKSRVQTVRECSLQLGSREIWFNRGSKGDSSLSITDIVDWIISSWILTYGRRKWRHTVNLIFYFPI